jgi:hypothetical protein
MWRYDVVLLDQSGFPWKLHDNYEVDGYWAMLEPLRERKFDSPKISTLVPYDEGVAAAYLDRVFNYMSRVEALDVEIRKIRSGTWFHDWASNDWLIDPVHDFNQDLEVTPKDTVTFADSRGMSWGPLNCDPMVEPATWPFSGSALSGNLVFTPIEHHKEAWTIKFGELNLDVFSVSDLITWVENLIIYGWFETIQKLCPNGMKLSHPGRGVPSAIDETYSSVLENYGMDDGG